MRKTVIAILNVCGYFSGCREAFSIIPHIKHQICGFDIKKSVLTSGHKSSI